MNNYSRSNADSRAAKSSLPKPLFHVVDYFGQVFVRFIANTQLGREIGLANDELRAQLAAQAIQLSQYAETTLSATETAGNMADVQLNLTRNHSSRAEEILEVLARSRYSELSGNQKMVLTLPPNLFRDMMVAQEMAQQYPIFYRLPPDVVPVVVEASRRLRAAGFDAVDIPADGMKQWVRCSALAGTNAEEYCAKYPDQLESVIEQVRDIDAFIQRSCSDLALMPYEFTRKVLASAKRATIPLSSEALSSVMDYGVLQQERQKYVFSDRHLANHSIETISSPRTQSRRPASVQVLAFDFDTVSQRTAAGHAFCDIAYKSNQEITNQMPNLRDTYYRAIGHTPSAATMVDEFYRMLRITAEYPNTWPIGIVSGTAEVRSRLEKLLGEPLNLQPTINSYVDTINLHGAQLVRVAR